MLLQFLDRGGGVLGRLVLRILATDFARLALRSLPSGLIIIILLDFFDAACFDTAGQKILRLRLFFVRFSIPLILERLLNELLVGTFDVSEEACKLATILVNELLEGLVNVGGGGLPRGGRRKFMLEVGKVDGQRTM